MDQTAKHVHPFDRRMGRHTGLRCSGTGGYGQAQSPMWSLLEVVGNVGLEHALEVPTPVDQEMVEAVGVGNPDSRSDHPGRIGRCGLSSTSSRARSCISSSVLDSLAKTTDPRTSRSSSSAIS